MASEANSDTNSKVLMVGLDGMSPHLLEWLVTQGHMPNVGKLMHAGVYRHLKSTIPPITPVAWTSFITGKNPGKHGIYGFLRFDSNNPRDGVSLVSSQSIIGETLPEILSRNKKKVGLINLAMTYPPKPLNGFMITGLMTPSLEKEFTYPAELKTELLAEFPDYDFTVHPQLFNLQTDKGFSNFIQRAINVITVRARACEYLMDKYEWDFLMVHFQSVDELQHGYYIGLDNEIRTKKEQWRKSQVIGFYQVLDSLIGNIVSKVDKENVVKIVMSDHGFGCLKGYMFPNILLINWGLLKPSKSIKRRLTVFRIANKIVKKPFFPIVRKIITRKYRKTFRGIFEESERTFKIENNLVLSETKAYFVPGGGSNYGYLYINKMHDDFARQGKPQTAYWNFRESLIKRLSLAKDPISGERLFEKIYRREQLYSSAMANFAPDLVVVPSLGWVISGKFTLRCVHNMVDSTQGTHREDGILIISGNDYIRRNIKLGRAEIIDLAPTILYIMGLEIPNDMDGIVLADVFYESYIKSHPIKYYEALERKISSQDVYSDSDRGKVEKRLKALGYI